MTVRELEIPRVLPVENFSASAINTYLKCPLKWKRRYVDREYEPPSGAMILGSSIGAAEGFADQLVVDGEPRPSTEDVLDLYAAEFDERADRGDVDWAGENAGDIKDHGVLAVKAYERDIVPSIEPVSVEREFQLTFDGVDWGFKGYLDLEEADGGVVDRKVRKSKLGQADADGDLQPTAYLLARRSEGNPATGFRYHTLVKTKTPYAEIVPTARTDRQLDAFIDRLYQIAAEIHWRLDADNWAGAVPGSWWCSHRFCGFYDSCPMGGAR